MLLTGCTPPGYVKRHERCIFPPLNLNPARVMWSYMHIRRGDVKQDRRFTANEKYVQLLDILAHHRPNAKIVIYSTGSPDQFKSIKKDRANVHFFLFPDLEMAFHAMVMAPLLITAKSAFSGTAAMLRINDYTHCPPPNNVAVTEACLSRLNWGLNP